MNLYEIEQEILDCIDTETGEIIDFDKINRLVLDKQTKIDNIACWYKQITAETMAIDNEIKILAGRKKAKENKAEDLKNYLSDILDGVKFETARNKITWRSSDEVSILNAALVPDKYKNEKFEVSISKNDIKAAIKAGAVVNSAELIYKNNIQIK